MFSSSAPRLSRRLCRIMRQVAHAQQQVAESPARRSRPCAARPSSARSRMRRHLLVGEAPADADGAVGEADVGLLPGRREVDDDALDVADLALLQAGQAVGDHSGKHRNDALRQVDAGAALAGLAVEGAAGRGEVGHVGDVDAEQPVLALRVDASARRRRRSRGRRPGRW